MKAREFGLINEKGQKYSFMDLKNNCFLTSPSGLGYSYSNQYEQLGNIFINTLSKIEKGKISGTANFINYDNYSKLVNFIESSENLRICYIIPFKDGNKEYLKDIKIQSLSKTERKNNHLISETIVFDCLGLWYQNKEIVYTIDTLEDEVQWNFRWNARFSDYKSRTIEFNNEGHVEAPFQLELDDNLINPAFFIVNNGKIVNSLNFNFTLNRGEKILYSSKDKEIYLKRQYENGEIENMFKQKYIDINNTNIFKFPKGVNQFTITADNNIYNAKLNVFEQYKVV